MEKCKTIVPVKLTDSQHGTLHTLAEFGPQKAVEVHGPRGMDGKRKVKLEWHAASIVQLRSLEDRGLVAVDRSEAPRPVNAVGKLGHKRVALIIAITQAGRDALAAA